MKRIVVISILFLVISLISADLIEFTYEFEKPVIENKGGFKAVEFKDTRQIGNPGSPMLPYKAVKLLLPPGHKAVSVNYEWQNLKNIEEKLELYPAQYVRPISAGESGSFSYDSKIYNSKSEFPNEKAGKLSTEYMNGYGFALTTFTPAIYIPAKKQFSYYASVKVSIETAFDSKYKGNNLSSRKEVLQRVEKFAQNKNMLFRYPHRGQKNSDYELLIITTAQFSDNFEEYIDIYQQRAARSELVTIEYIDGNIAGQDTQERMRNYIIQEYQNNDIAYVLLAGDVEHVPYRGFYCQVQSSSVYEDDDIPADIYFSALDGSWNDDGDGYWGEEDEDDLLPEVAVARMPFSDEDELYNMLNKTFDYQNDPVLGELDKPLLAGEHLYDSPETWGGNYLDLLIEYHEDNGYTTNGIPETDDIETLYERDTGSWNGSTLMNKLNSGKSFLHHVGHANSNYVAHMYTSDITNSNFYALNGEDHNFTLMYSHGCICGAFDDNDCIAEHMVKIENFATAFIGNSRYGWFNEGQTEGPSQHIHREFVDALYDSRNNRLGATHMESKIDTAPWVEAPDQWEEGALRWCFYDCNVLGDVMTSIWTAEPVDVNVDNDEVIVMGSESFQVNISENGAGAEDMYCTLLKDNIVYGVGQTDVNGNATIYFNEEFTEPGYAELVISGYNCLPQEYQIPVIVDGEVPYLIVEGYEISSGQDDLIEYGESAEIFITLKNVGNQTASGINSSLTCDDEFIELQIDELTIESIAADEIASFSQPFVFNVSNQIPDQHNFIINLQSTSEEGNWESTIYLTAYAPVLEVANNITIDDGDNGRLDPGDTADLYV
ncbi:MAG: C25 family cysteine peptidase, partial [Candidatus Cloacimonadota bacterium]|nr:C25 family cysteine peptidase [Candidatus Cloacimonadota bacterium]